MKKINVDDIKLQICNNEYLYIINYINEKLVLKRIKKIDNECKEIVIIEINDFIVNMNIYPSLNVSNEYKIKIINDILENLKKCSITNDIINIKELENLLKSNYINVLLSNGIIGLSNTNVSEIESNSYIIDIVLIESKSIIGTINYNKGELTINAEKIYQKTALSLFNTLIFALLKQNKDTYIKSLKNNS